MATCRNAGQGMRVVDSAGYLVMFETVRRACQVCGVVVTVEPNAFGLARVPDHDTSGPPQQ